MPPPFWTPSNAINKRCWNHLLLQIRKQDKIGTNYHLQDKTNRVKKEKLNSSKQSPSSASDRHTGGLAPYWWTTSPETVGITSHDFGSCKVMIVQSQSRKNKTKQKQKWVIQVWKQKPIWYFPCHSVLLSEVYICIRFLRNWPQWSFKSTREKHSWTWTRTWTTLEIKKWKYLLKENTELNGYD